MANDLVFQNFSTVQSNQQQFPSTIASATTVAPISLITFLTGTTGVATITPPVTGQHMLVFIYTNGSPGALATSGNILAAVTPVQNVPLLLFYDPLTAKYWAGTLKAS